MCNQTPFQQAGYTDNDEFVVVNTAKAQTPFEAAGYTPKDTFILIEKELPFAQGTQFKLHEDDGSEYPFFIVISSCSKHYSRIFNPSLKYLCKLIN